MEENKNRISELVDELIELKYLVMKERYKEYENKSFYCHLSLILNIKEVIKPDKVTDIFYIEAERISSDKYTDTRIIKIQLDYDDGISIRKKGLHYTGIPCESIDDNVKAQIMYHFDIVSKKYWEHISAFQESKKKIAKIIEDNGRD